MNWHTTSMFNHQKDFLRSFFGLESRDPATILKERSALLLSGSHPLTHGAWQYLPNVIEVRDFHQAKRVNIFDNLLTKKWGGTVLYSQQG